MSELNTMKEENTNNSSNNLASPDIPVLPRGMLTIEQLEKALPKGFRHNATQKLVDKINGLAADEDLREAYRDNILSYTKVIADGRFQIGHYIDAVKYITHKLMGASNIEAFVKTFPDRYQKFLTNGTSQKDIASYITSYNKNKLVNLIREQTIIPTYVLNADLYQEAINKQASLMNDPKVSFAVQQKAAESLLNNLKPPEVAKVEIGITNKENSLIDELRETTLRLAAKQKELLEAGVINAKDTAESPLIIEGELSNTSDTN